MESTTMANIQEGTSNDLSQGSLMHNHQMNPQIGSSSQGPKNNVANYSTHQINLTSLLEATLEESDREENIMRSKLLANHLGPHAMNEREQNYGEENDQRQLEGRSNLGSIKTIGSKGSLYRGVIKCHHRRFEAFAWDNTGERGRIVYIGAYLSEIDAARAHDMVSIKIRGLCTLINFSVGSYCSEIEFMKKMSKKDYIENVRGRGGDYTIECECHFRGVYRVPEKRKWEARLGRKGLRTISLGAYYTAEDAARAYDIISIKLKRWNAITNFDISSYEVKSIMKSVITQQMDGSIILRITERNNEAEANPQQLSNSTLSHGCENPNVISSNPEFEAYPQSNSSVQQNPQQLSNSTLSHGFQNPNLISSNPEFEAYPQSNSSVQQNPQQLSNSSSSHGFQNPNLIPSNLGIEAYPQSSSGQRNPRQLSNSCLSLGRQNSNFIASNLGIEAYPQRSSGQRNPRQLSNSSLSLGHQNPNLIASNLGIQAYPHSSFGQSNPQQRSNSSSSHGNQNPNLIPSNLGIQAYPQSSSLGQHNSQQLTNSSFPYGFQDPNLMPSNYGFRAYPQSSSLGQHNTLDGFISGIGNSGNSIANLGGEFPDQNATLQHSLQIQNQVINVNNNFYQNLHNNNNNNNNNDDQFLPQSSNPSLLANVNQNLELENSLHFPNFLFDFGTRLLGGDKEFGPLSTLSALYEQSGALTNGMVNGSTGATNGACSSGSGIQPVAPSNQEIGAAQLQLPELNQSYEPCNIQANTLNLQDPHQNLNSLFSEGFQNPSSQLNNTGSQSHAIGSENDLGVIDFLNRSYIEDNDFACDFDFFAAMNGDKQGL